MHTRKYYLAIKTEILPFAAIWMEGIMLSEVSQTEKDKYCISLICGIYKIEQTGESACNAGDPGLIPGWEDPLEKEMAIRSSILAWKILWTEEPGGLQSMGSQELDTTQQLNHHHNE